MLQQKAMVSVTLTSGGKPQKGNVFKCLSMNVVRIIPHILTGYPVTVKMSGITLITFMDGYCCNLIMLLISFFFLFRFNCVVRKQKV